MFAPLSSSEVAVLCSAGAINSLYALFAVRPVAMIAAARRGTPRVRDRATGRSTQFRKPLFSACGERQLSPAENFAEPLPRIHGVARTFTQHSGSFLMVFRQ